VLWHDAGLHRGGIIHIRCFFTDGIARGIRATLDVWFFVPDRRRNKSMSAHAQLLSVEAQLFFLGT